MKIYNDIPENKNLFNNPVVTIGTFDGVHIGHQKILKKLRESADALNGEAVVITFSNHPRKVLFPDQSTRILTTSEEKVKAIYGFGVLNIILLDFTPDMANMTAHDFYSGILLKKLDLKGIVIGYDHAFGRDREGNYDYLKKITGNAGITLTRVEEEDFHTYPVSSTWIRNEIEYGRIRRANTLLGRPYSLKGRVTRGAGRGRKLGFPTANIVPENPDKIIPGDGVYAVTVLLDDRTGKNGMMNIGINPTFQYRGRSLEVNIFDYDNTLYDRDIDVSFHARIRDEIRFSSIDDLIAQMNIDKQSALKVLG